MSATRRNVWHLDRDSTIMGTHFSVPAPALRYLYDFMRAGAYDNNSMLSRDIIRIIVCPPEGPSFSLVNPLRTFRRSRHLQILHIWSGNEKRKISRASISIYDPGLDTDTRPGHLHRHRGGWFNPGTVALWHFLQSMILYNHQ